MGAPQFLQVCPCGHTEALGNYCTQCYRPTEQSDIRQHRVRERIPCRGSRASKELRRDPRVPKVRGVGVSRPYAHSGSLQEAA